MTGQTPGAAEADYDEWVGAHYDRDRWDQDDPANRRHAFTEGWTRGAAYVALHISREMGPHLLPKGIVDHLLRGDGIEVPPGR